MTFIVFVCHFNNYAQAVYVDSNIGNDNNDGSEGSPLFSITKAAEIMGSRKNNNIYVCYKFQTKL